jgi:hypothetical protein
MTEALQIASGMPDSTTMVMPQVVTPGPGTQPGLMPAALLNPLPSITSTEPAVISNCDPFTQWVSDNPLLAVGALFALYAAVRK